MHLLSPFLQWLFKKKKDEEGRAFASDILGVDLSTLNTQSEQIVALDETGKNPAIEKTVPQEFEIFPEDPAVRKQWFLLTIRERQVVALVCMGHRNYEIASILGVGYPTIQTHLQNIFRKFDLRSRGEIRTALISWQAEEWWNYHHY